MLENIGFIWVLAWSGIKVGSHVTDQCIGHAICLVGHLDLSHSVKRSDVTR